MKKSVLGVIAGVLALCAAAWWLTRAPDEAPAPPASAEARQSDPPSIAAAIPNPGPSDASTDTKPDGLAAARVLLETDPAAAVRWMVEDESRHPDAAHSDERSLLKMSAYVKLNQIGLMRQEGERFFEKFPQSPLADRVTQLTGAHPRPRPGPVTSP